MHEFLHSFFFRFCVQWGDCIPVRSGKQSLSHWYKISFLFAYSNQSYLLQLCMFLTLILFQDVPAFPFVTTFWERNFPSVGGFFKFMGVSSVLTIATVVGVVAYKKGLLPRSQSSHFSVSLALIKTAFSIQSPHQDCATDKP